MAGIEPQADPAALGFDAGRLQRLDAHFDRYVEQGRLAGYLAVVARHGTVVHVACTGDRNVESSLPLRPDTIFRIYSMTKPITAAAALMLYEEGAFELTDPVGRYLESFRHQKVFVAGSTHAPKLVPAAEPVRVWHLLSHTAGLTYGFARDHPVDAMYRARGYELAGPPGKDLAGACDDWASMPLLFEPGTRWNYSVALDVVGRLIEIWSGQRLDRFLSERIFEPLGMVDTGFCLSDDAQRDRLATLYAPGPPPDRTVANFDEFDPVPAKPPTNLSGGAGLVSTAADYQRFATMLLRRGELGGVRLLSPHTVDRLAANHLPGGADLERVGRPIFAAQSQAGIGFGLGLSVVIDPVATRTLCSPGEHGWSGAASTTFWVDPVEQVTVTFFTQLIPPGTLPLETELHQLVYQALVGPAPTRAS